MNKAIKITIASVLAVVLLLVAALSTLALIKVKPLKAFSDYSAVLVVDSIDESGPGPVGKTGIIEQGLKTVEFRMISAFFGGDLDYKIKLNYAVINEDEEFVSFPEQQGDRNEPVTVEGKDAIRNITPSSSEYMLRFEYSSTQTHSRFRDEDCQKIEYDTLIMIIPESNGKIQTVKLYPYMSSELSTPRYLIYEFSAKMYTSKLYDKLYDELDKSSDADEQSGSGATE